jgi:hypothetical protein
MRKQSQPIEKILKRFRKCPEWLLIRVDEIDESTTTPLTGRLLAHHPNRDVIYRKSLDYKRLTLLIDHPEEKLPEGYAVAF